jgi:hypothetical protein
MLIQFCEAFEAHLSKLFVYSVSVYIGNHVMEFASNDYSATPWHVGDKKVNLILRKRLKYEDHYLLGT